LLASRLTTTNRCSSEVRAIVVDRVGAASAFVYATKGMSTAAIAISSVGGRRQNLADKLRNTKFCECFMNIPPGVSFAINPDQRCARRQACIVRAEHIVRNPGNPYEDVEKIPDRIGSAGANQL